MKSSILIASNLQTIRPITKETAIFFTVIFLTLIPTQRLLAGDPTSPTTQTKEKTTRAKSQRATEKEKKLAAARAEAPEMGKVVVTGSYIPRAVKRNGNITDTPYALYVIDSKQIERSGAATLAGVLRTAGYSR